jgi:hypothetical protein
VARPPRKLPLPEGAELEEGAAAIAEAAAVAGGLDLSSRASLNKINKLLRRDKMDGHLHFILVIGVYFVGLCAAGVFGCVVWNMSVPVANRFLDATQLATLQQFLFSGALGAGVSAAARRIAGDDADKSDDE